MSNHPFGEQNPYEPPVVAEVVEKPPSLSYRIMVLVMVLFAIAFAYVAYLSIVR